MTKSGELRSLSSKDYQTLPKLEAPAAYVCVIRDIDAGTYRIDSTDFPRAFVEALLSASKRSFGFELVAILKTENLQASESELYARHHARLSKDWLDLDAYQLEELRRSILDIDARRSHYLPPQKTEEPTAAIPRAEIRYGTLMTSSMGAPGRAEWREGQRTRGSLLSKADRAASLQRRSQPAGGESRSLREAPSSLRALIEGRFTYLIWNDPGCLLLVWIGLLALGLAYLIFVGIRSIAV